MGPDAGAFSAEAEWRLGKKQILDAIVGVTATNHLSFIFLDSSVYVSQ